MTQRKVLSPETITISSKINKNLGNLRAIIQFSLNLKENSSSNKIFTSMKAMNNEENGKMKSWKTMKREGSKRLLMKW